MILKKKLFLSAISSFRRFYYDNDSNDSEGEVEVEEGEMVLEGENDRGNTEIEVN